MGKYESNRETRRRKAKNTLPLWVVIPILITAVLCVVTLWAIFDSRQTPPEETRPATEAPAPSTEVNTDPPAEQTTVSPVETTEPPAETTVQTEPSIRDSEAYQKLLMVDKADQFDESVLEAFAQWIEEEKDFLDTYPEKWELERLYTGTVSLTCFTPMTEDYHRTLCSLHYDGVKVFVNTIIDRHYTDVPRETVAAMVYGAEDPIGVSDELKEEFIDWIMDSDWFPWSVFSSMNEKTVWYFVKEPLDHAEDQMEYIKLCVDVWNSDLEGADYECCWAWYNTERDEVWDGGTEYFYTEE